MRRQNRGSQTVEFALILPLILFISSGIIDFGWYFYKQNILLQLVRDNARGASVLDSRESEISPCQFFTQNYMIDSERLGMGQDVTISLQIVSDSEKRLEIIVSQEYSPLFGLVTTPSVNSIRTLVRLEDQNWEGC